jgi:hypothetical protein
METSASDSGELSTLTTKSTIANVRGYVDDCFKEKCSSLVRYSAGMEKPGGKHGGRVSTLSRYGFMTALLRRYKPPD